MHLGKTETNSDMNAVARALRDNQALPRLLQGMTNAGPLWPALRCCDRASWGLRCLNRSSGRRRGDRQDKSRSTGYRSQRKDKDESSRSPDRKSGMIWRMVYRKRDNDAVGELWNQRGPLCR